MTWPGHDQAAGLVGWGHLRASDADREQATGTLRAAFAQGRLTRDELDVRIGQALAARTYADLAAVTAGIDVARARPPRQPPRRQAGNAARWAASGLVTPVILAAAVAHAELGGDGRPAAVAFVIAFAYFMFWLSVGADMLWQWHCASLPAARMCVRCAHTAAAHGGRASCAVRPGSLPVWRRCPCAGYIPPGLSPQTADPDRLAATG
jgi:Domain of unknown function (DUF1707)